ncbi:hypothetical protein [Curtobacterium sp. 18060]|uniref:hypothetical protein n=1 Tax=Curtobacterium sp. 18060 TaxID=2681408 RepID=UPI001357E4AF|nr:hypothetical protein [Curtobacterium sp. 18060]
MTKISELDKEAASIISSVFSLSEQRQLTLEFADATGAVIAPEQEVVDGYICHVYVLDELMTLPLFGHESGSDFATRFQSETVDFISETKFGWGQRRG